MLPVALVVLCVATRLLPHPPNFVPVGATAVFAGRTLPLSVALPLTLVAMFIADLGLAAIHGYAPLSWVTPFIYAGFITQTLLGRALRRRRGGAVGAAILGAVGFFLLSNFGVWIGGYYGITSLGLVTCYAMALPFFGATIAADILWTVGLGLAHRSMARRLSATMPSRDELPVV